MKIRRISEFQSRLSFPNFDSNYEKYLQSFQSTELGMIYNAIPWQELVKTFSLSNKKKGPSSIFSPRGKLALMFLKNYCCCSDKKLIAQFNGNIYYQIFCDTLLDPGQGIKNYKIVSQIRCELAEQLDIDKTEKVLITYWKPYMSDLGSITTDATCYESSIKYPTDVKLLMDSVDWIYSQIQVSSRNNQLPMPRTKYKKWKRRSLSYSKMKQKRKKKRIPLLRGLLRLLTKLIPILEELELNYGFNSLNAKYLRKRQTIKTILKQQSDKFYKGERPKQAIVSIDKPYIRPIIRGKENKPVEFGAKLNKLQIDGISFIEHVSFEAFHEGNRLQKTIWKAQKLTGKRVKIVGADAIYATNANRKYTSSKNIQTDFKPKGRPGKNAKHKKQLAAIITKERATRLEGSFGTDKNYFLLNKIKARTKQSEIFWIFLGIHTSNALNIGRRMNLKIAQAA